MDTTTTAPIALPTITTVQELKVFLANSPLLAYESYFFSKGAMSFFNSKIATGFYVAESTADSLEAYFITSEQYEAGTPRIFSVRKVVLSAHLLEDGTTTYRHDIETQGNGYATIQAARAAAKLAAKGE